MRQACFRLARAFATKSKGGGAGERGIAASAALVSDSASAASSNDVRGSAAQSLFSLEASQRHAPLRDDPCWPLSRARPDVTTPSSTRSKESWASCVLDAPHKARCGRHSPHRRALTCLLPGLLDHILVPLPSRPAAPLPSLCSVSVQDVQTLRLNLYDPSTAPALEAALRASPLKLSPRVAEGGSQTVLVSVPPPSEETRQRVLKLVKEAGETARAAGRRVRQDSFDAVRSSGKAGASKDDVKRMEVKLQVQADAFVKTLTSLVAAKEKEAA
jgi:ribosome recycling factor